MLGPLHLVSLWATEEHLSLGPLAVDGKSNEITAIPQLLDMVDVAGAVVTIDAMGCQKTIAAKIRNRGVDYVLALKRNQAYSTLPSHLSRLPRPTHDAVGNIQIRSVRREEPSPFIRTH